MQSDAHASLPVALSIAGSDSGGGAGIQADLLSFAALGAYGTTAITCLTAQNPSGVSAVEAMPASFVDAQVRQVLAYFDVAAIKTGMLFDASIIRQVSSLLREHRSIPVVVDPVMVATSGARLLRPDAETALVDELLPLATVVTPNLDEAAVLLGAPITSATEALAAAVALRDRHGVAFLVKGGHLAGDRILDVLAAPGAEPRTFAHARVHGVDTHGTGCTLSSAIAAGLARGLGLIPSIEAAHRYLLATLTHPARVEGRAFLGHLASN